MIRKLFLAVVAVIATLTAAAQNADMDALKADVAAAAAQCPMTFSQGLVFDSIGLTDTALEIHSSMDVPAAQFDQIRGTFDMMRPTLLKSFGTQNETKQLFAKLMANGLGFNFFIHTKEDPSKMLEMKFTPQELSDGLK
ncbi:MAG: hypothetical protein K2M12_00605 [Muribaculaceae bacterium]|nr:hypothetical protein [Muribaculaceae bacterium]